MSSGGTYTSADVALHMTSSDCWIVVNGKVYSVASYISMHPGGQSIIIAQCGKDATVTFTNRGGTGAHSTSAWSLLNTFLIGTLSSIVTPTTPTVSNGVCGTSNGTTLSSVPTSGFCSTGTATSVSGTGPWSWSCAGSSGGSTASCSASKTQAVSFTYTLADVATHTTSASCWFIVNSNVYSVASYLSLHPGGKTVILNQCGKDATTAFSTRGNTGGHSASAWSLLNQYLIGTYTTAITPITPTTPVAINGICGTSNGTTVSTVPTTNFCSVGASSSIAGIGPWSWSCAGSSGGSTASCSASLASGQTTPTTPTTYTVHVTSQGNYDITALTLRAGDSITFVYSTPMSGEVDTRFSPTGISSVKIDKDITQKTRVFPSTGTWTFKAVDKSGNTGTITVK
jgi:cytochrome b involved in lipid metabolism